MELLDLLIADIHNWVNDSKRNVVSFITYSGQYMVIDKIYLYDNINIFREIFDVIHEVSFSYTPWTTLTFNGKRMNQVHIHLFKFSRRYMSSVIDTKNNTLEFVKTGKKIPIKKDDYAYLCTQHLGELHNVKDGDEIEIDSFFSKLSMLQSLTFAFNYNDEIEKDIVIEI